MLARSLALRAAGSALRSRSQRGCATALPLAASLSSISTAAPSDAVLALPALLRRRLSSFASYGSSSSSSSSYDTSSEHAAPLPRPGLGWQRDATAAPERTADRGATERRDVPNVLSVTRGGVIQVPALEGAALGTLVRVRSSVAGVGAVSAVVLRVTAEDVFAGLLCEPHLVAVGDAVEVPALPYTDRPPTAAEVMAAGAGAGASEAEAEAEAEPAGAGSARVAAWPTFPVGLRLMGRVVDALGRPLDGGDAGSLLALPRATLKLSGSPTSQRLVFPPAALLADVAAGCPDALRALAATADGWAATARLGRQLPIIGRVPEGAPLWTGVKHVDLLHPLRRGLRVALIGEHSTRMADTAAAILGALARSDDVPATPLSPSSSPPPASDATTFVYVSLGQSRRHLEEALVRLADAGVRDRTCVVVAGQADPPALQHLALLSGAALATHLQARGRHVVVVIDDLSAHARAYFALHESFGAATAHVVSAVQSQLLESFSQLGPALGGGSATALCLLEERPQHVGLDEARAKMVRQNVLSTVDHVIPLNTELHAAALWPAIEASPASRALRFQAPALRALVHRANEALAESRDAFERSRVGEELGLHTDEEVLELVHWRPKMQLLLSQTPEAAPVPIEEQYLLLTAAVHPRLLAGVPMHKVGVFEDVLLARARAELPRHLAAVRAAIDAAPIAGAAPSTAAAAAAASAAGTGAS